MNFCMYKTLGQGQEMKAFVKIGPPVLEKKIFEGFLYLDFLFSAGSGLDRPNLGCFHYLERVPGLAMYGLGSM